MHLIAYVLCVIHVTKDCYAYNVHICTGCNKKDQTGQIHRKIHLGSKSKTNTDSMFFKQVYLQMRKLATSQHP